MSQLYLYLLHRLLNEDQQIHELLLNGELATLTLGYLLRELVNEGYFTEKSCTLYLSKIAETVTLDDAGQHTHLHETTAALLRKCYPTMRIDKLILQPNEPMEDTPNDRK